MPVISVCSPKGGVGKTTLSANLAYIFARAGTKVITIDFDPQNALRLYFGVPLSEESGFIDKVQTNADWTAAAINVGTNLFTIPFGKSTMQQRKLLDELLSTEDYLKNYQSSLFCNPNILVIADFPPGFSQSLFAASCVTDLNIIPLIADAASIALFNQIQTNELLERPLNERYGYSIVLNQIDNRIKINREIQDFAVSNFNDKLLGFVHADTSVVEAAAMQEAIEDYNPNSAALFDMQVLAKKIATKLGFEVRKDTMILNPLRNRAEDSNE